MKKRTYKQWWEERTLADSPVEDERKTLPRGSGDWLGYEAVYRNISQACDKMAVSGHRLTDLHVTSMAILGCGHEETMKLHQILLRTYGWI